MIKRVFFSVNFHLELYLLVFDWRYWRCTWIPFFLCWLNVWCTSIVKLSHVARATICICAICNRQNRLYLGITNWDLQINKEDTLYCIHQLESNVYISPNKIVYKSRIVFNANGTVINNIDVILSDYLGIFFGMLNLEHQLFSRCEIYANDFTCRFEYIAHLSQFICAHFNEIFIRQKINWNYQLNCNIIH